MTGSIRRATLLASGVTFAIASLLTASSMAADHSEAPTADENRPADIADVFAFLDPADNTRLVVAATLVGFIVPSENVNQGAFSPEARYRFELETTGDAKPDQFIDVTFDARPSTTTPQTATISLLGKGTFTAPTTVPSVAAAAPAFTVTEDPTSGARFFAGLVDDPFFFDIPGFNRFVASVLQGAPDPTKLQRGRDSFAGYNDQAIAISVPLSFIGAQTNKIGVDFLAQMPRQRIARVVNGRRADRKQEFVSRGTFVNVDRMGNPAINTVLIPFARKDEYNFASTQDDANGRFADDIVATLTKLGTNATNIGILASVAVTNGDFLRVDPSVANSGPGGGNNAGAGFPNGRRLADDVIDTILFFVANQTPLGDSVNGNDVPLGDTFPFFAPPHQPLNSGIDDFTRN